MSLVNCIQKANKVKRVFSSAEVQELTALAAENRKTMENQEAERAAVQSLLDEALAEQAEVAALIREAAPAVAAPKPAPAPAQTPAVAPAGEVAAVEPAPTTGTESLNKRHAIAKKQVMTPGGALKADATNSRADSAVWYYQGDMNALRFTASVVVDGKPDPRADDAKRMLVQIKAAQDAGWRRANYRAGSLGTVWVFERGDEFLTRAGMENAAAVEVQRPVLSEDRAGYAAMATQQFELARAFDDWLNTLPDDQQDNRGVVVRKMGETPVGEWARVEDDIGNGVALRYYEKDAPQFRIGFGARNWPELRAYVRELAKRFDQSRDADENALYTLVNEAARAANAAEPGSTVPAGWVFAAGLRFIGSVDAEVARLNAANDGNEYREFRGGIIQRPAERNASTAVAAPTKPATAIDAFKAVMQAVYDGKATVEDYQAGYARVRDETAMKAELGKMTKDELTRMFGIMRDGKKDELVALAYASMLRSFAMGKSYGPSGGYMMTRSGIADYEAKKRAALDELVAGQTADDLAAFAAEQKRISEERAGKRAEMAEAIKNPKTLEDFQNFIRYHQQDGKSFTQARMMLTPEQRAAYDELVATDTRGKRKERTDEQRTTVRAAGQTTAGEIIATKHTRDGHDLWVVKLADRVSKDDYVTLLASAKRLGGSYSSYRLNGAVPGFQFRTPDAAQAFLKLAGGDTAAATEVAQERRNAFEDDRSQSAAERLTEMADRLEERADESLGRDRKANTDRRARFAAAAEAAANADKAMAGTMRNIAKAITGGGAKFLDRVRQKVQVELLQTYVANGMDAMRRAKYPTYAEQERHKGEAPTIEAADYAEFPTFTAYRSDLASLGRQLLEVDGTKKLGEQIMKVADDVSDAFTAFAKEPGNLFKLSTFSVRAGDEVRAAIFPTREGAERAITRSGLSGKAIVFPEKRGVNRIIMSPSEAMARGIWKGDGDKRITLAPEGASTLVEKIGRVARRGAKVSVPWQFERAYDRRKQLARMGIETPAEFRAALREFIAMREQPAEADKIKAMERAMVGRRNDGLDFFPTPESVADEMVAAADIQPGMRVLEPSAGFGHIAERIREAGHQPDVVEFSNDRKELLEAKGFNVVGRDFMEFTDANQADRGFTYGDVFRAPDGTVGVLRGSNGLGGDRVGLDPLDENGQPDRRRMQWHTFSDLEPVEKRGVGSGYDRILMNPPFSDGRDIQHVRHAYDLLKPGGRLVAIMGESAFFNQNKRATEFREWLDGVGGTSEKLPEGTFNDPSLPVTTGANARMVVIDKPASPTGPRAVIDGPGADAQFSRAQPGRTGVPMADAKAVVAAIREALPTAPQINLHDSVKKAPENLRRLIRQAGADNDVEAAYHEGEIHVFPGNIASIERMQFVVAHHEIRHHGLRSMLGPAMGPAMLRMYASNPNLKAAADQKMADGLAATRVLAVEEALADMPVEALQKLTGWQRIVSAARQWLRQVAANLRRAGLTTLADALEPSGWTDADIAALLQKAENVSRGGAAPFRTGGTVFGRADQTQTPAFRRWFGDSKVVDAQGKPLVVYHGSPLSEAISEFKAGEAGAYFSSSQNVADGYTSKRGMWLGPKTGAVSSVYLSLRNPLVIDAMGKRSDNIPVPWREWKPKVYGNLPPNAVSVEAAAKYAKEQGHDGLIVRNVVDTVTTDGKGKSDVYAVFNPEQIKSATGNNGDFSPSNADIRFSRAGTAKTTAQDLLNSNGGVFGRAGDTRQDRVRAVVDGSRPFWLGALTRDQIADMYGDELPPVRDYDNLTRAMENERQSAAQKADELYEEWSKIDAEANDRLARVMLDATVAQVHPDRSTLPATATEEQRQAHGRLRAQFNLLPKDAQAMYGKVRDFHANTLKDLRAALEGRIARLIENGSERAVALAEIRARFDQYMQGGPYFPLHRFGDFLVVAERAKDGERVVAAYENAGEQQAAARALEADGFAVKLTMAKAYSRSMDGSAGKFIGDVLAAIDKMDMREASINGSATSMKAQLLDDLNQLFIKALPDLSYRKHFTHRKGTAGFSADVMRGFASSAFHAAGHIARLNHGDKMTFALEDAYQQIKLAPEGDFTRAGQVLNEMALRHEAALNPNVSPLSALATQVGFVMYLGLSPAAGLINMMQVPMVALPYIGARYGFAKATAAMGRAYTDIMGAKPNAKNGFNAAQSPKLSADERRAISTLQDEGVIDLTQAHDLAAATTRDVGNQARNKASFAIARAMRIVGWTFHVPEVMNRQVTALMAYRLEMAKSGDEGKAMDAAREAIKRSQFDYSSSNRARFMQGDIARVVTQFRQFSQNMTYFLGRAAYQALKGEDPEVRRIARQQLVATFLVTGAMAGSLGLPGLGFFAGLVEMLVNGMGDDDDEPWDWKVAYRNMLADNFGKEWGEVMARGVPRALMPAWDISNRVSLSDLWWRDNSREGDSPREAFANDMSNILGPTAGTLLGWYTASDHMARGDYAKAVESVVPKFIRDPLKAWRESQDGVTSYNGEQLLELTGAEVAGRFLGFAPSRASEMYEGRSAVMGIKTALEDRRQRLVSQMAKARIDGDTEAVAELQQRIRDWNTENPKMAITGATIVRSVLNRRRNTANTEKGITLPDSKDFLRDRARFAEVD